MKENLLPSLKKVEHIAHASKVSRLLHDPVKYLFALGFNNIVIGQNVETYLAGDLNAYLNSGKMESDNVVFLKANP